MPRLNLKNLLLPLTALSLVVSTASAANELEARERVPTEELVEGIKSSDGRWFEVEMIIFEQSDHKDIRETFDQTVQNLTSRREWNLLEPVLKPDLTSWLKDLPHCLRQLDPMSAPEAISELSPRGFWAQFQNYQRSIATDWQIDDLYCLTANESLPEFWLWYLDIDASSLAINQNIHWPEMPIRPTGPNFDDFHNVYLLGQQNLKLMEEFSKLARQASTRPLLHFGWRQPGLSKRRARPMRIVAGTNFTDKFRYDGTAIVNPENIAQPEELDGEDVGQTPPNSNLELNSPISPEQELVQQSMSDVQKFMEKLQGGAVVDFKRNKLVLPEHHALPDETWQLDGYVTVHLNHYLFLEAAFNYRQLKEESIDPTEFLDELDLLAEQGTDPSATEQDVLISKLEVDNEFDAAPNQSDKVQIQYLENFGFKQTRRTYSGDLHYLDHPKLGVLFQIRKYRH